jgi:dihydropyrimidinase
MDILIKNGTIVNTDKSFGADILIINGKIAKIGTPLTATAPNTKIIDASGKYIFPGGIDPHVHLHLPGPAGFSSDDFYTGSKAALYGGTTFFIDFVTPRKGQGLIEALHDRKKEASSSLIDHTFHVSPVEWRDSMTEEIKACVTEGITSFKIYMAYLDTIGLKDKDIQKVMKAVAEAGGMITVHCELGEEVDRLRKEFIKNGQISPKYHPLSRPNYVESEAVKKAIDFANEAGCPVYIVHVSTKESLEHIKKAQQKGQKVFAETCPHYLLLDDSKYLGEFANTAPFVMSPPLRKKEDNEALWQALADGTIQTVGTDHCPFTLDQKKYGIHDFTKIPNGAGGIEHRMALLFTFGVLKNRINLNRFVELISTNPAKIFGLYPKKGAVKIDSDADIVIWNPERENIISAKTHHQNYDINIFEGIHTKGEAEIVIVGGDIVLNRSGD